VGRWWQLIAGPHGHPLVTKVVRYSLGSVVALAVSETTLVVIYATHLLGPKAAAITGTLAGALPNYHLNRRWAWNRRGRSHLGKEVVPYVVTALAGLAFSTWAVDFASSHASHLSSRALEVFLVAVAYVGSFGLLWVAKFVFFNLVLFAGGDRGDRPLLMGASGGPEAPVPSPGRPDHAGVAQAVGEVVPLLGPPGQARPHRDRHFDDPEAVAQGADQELG
jgi:putative flippase GtrA